MTSVHAANGRYAVRYVSDNGENYAMSAKYIDVGTGDDSGKYGASAAQAADLVPPKQMKPRRVKCTSSGLADKWVIAYTTSATIWTTPGTTLTLNNAGVDATYTATSTRRAERWASRRIAETS